MATNESITAPAPRLTPRDRQGLVTWLVECRYRFAGLQTFRTEYPNLWRDGDSGLLRFRHRAALKDRRRLRRLPDVELVEEGARQLELRNMLNTEFVRRDAEEKERDQDAHRGKELLDRCKQNGSIRGKDTSAKAAKGKLAALEEAKRIREKHPHWSTSQVAQLVVHKHNPYKLSLSTIRRYLRG